MTDVLNDVDVDVVGGGPSARPDPPSPYTPLLRGRFVELVPLTDAGISLLWQWETHPANFFTYRLRGLTPPADAYQHMVWDGSLVQFLVVSRDEQRPVGVVNAYRSDMRSGYCHVGAIYDPEQIDGKRLRGDLEGVELFCAYLFRVIGLRKLYFEVFDWNMPKFSAFFSTMCSREAHLRDHEYFDDRYWDLHLFALTRERWFANAQRIDETAQAIRAATDASADDDQAAW